MLLLVDVTGYLSQVQDILSPLFGIGPSRLDVNTHERLLGIRVGSVTPPWESQAL